MLFHVTATAEWSTLPLSGLFVQMLERLSVSSAADRPEAADLEGTTWQPVQLLTATGRIEPAGTLPGVPGEALIDAPLGADLQPGSQGAHIEDGPDHHPGSGAELRRPSRPQ